MSVKSTAVWAIRHSPYSTDSMV